MPTAYILVGIPGSGKSTWASQQEWAPNCEYISSDQFVEAHAHDIGKTYSEVFTDFMPTALRLMNDQVEAAVAAKRDIIWDQTNTTVKSRSKKFDALPGYKMIAVIFKTPEHKELIRRLFNRPGKEIPEHVIASMIASLELPTEQEGFKEIWHAA